MLKNTVLAGFAISLVSTLLATTGAMAANAPISATITTALPVAPATQQLNCSSVEGGISFTVSESFVKGAYDHSGAVLSYEGITYEISKSATVYDQNLGQDNIATLFSVSIPNTNPTVFFTFDVPRSQTSLALNANAATSILMGVKKFAAVCHVL